MKSFKFIVAVLALFLGGFASVMAEDAPSGFEAKRSTDHFLDRLIVSTDEGATYEMLVPFSRLLSHLDGMIILQEQLLQFVDIRLTDSASEIKKFEEELGQIKANQTLADREIKSMENWLAVSKSNFRDLLQRKRDLEVRLSLSKEKFARWAKVYNQKMAETNFRFADAATLPSGKTVVLPKQFAIR